MILQNIKIKQASNKVKHSYVFTASLTYKDEECCSFLSTCIARYILPMSFYFSPVQRKIILVHLRGDLI